MTDQRTSIPGGFRTTAVSFSRGTSMLVGSCAAVATAAYLGAHWLREPILGLPSGVWLIAIAQGAACAIWQRQDRHWTPGPAATTEAAATPSAGAEAPQMLAVSAGSAPLAAARAEAAGPGNLLGLDLLPLLGRFAAAAWDIGRAAASGLRIAPERIAEIEEQLGAPLDRRPITARPLRIGLDVEGELAAAIRGAPYSPAAAIEWFRVPAGMDDARDLSRRRLDALVRRRDGGLRIITQEHIGRDAAWYDWSALRPLSYASVFPLRIDPALISLGDVEVGDVSQAPLIVQLAQLAAALSRTPARLTLSDRLFGRRAMIGLRTPDMSGAPLPAEACARDLAMQINRWSPEPSAAAQPPSDDSRTFEPGAARRAAARAASAWAATTEAWVELALRRQIVECAARLLPGEPEILLRLAAVCFADGDDAAAHEALLCAGELIRRQGHEQIVDHLAFLESELQLGTPGPMTLGRVAAGICLVCATSPAERLGYIRGDLMDDIRYSSWLVGRDQDRAVLMDVFRVLERAPGNHGETRQAA